MGAQEPPRPRPPPPGMEAVAAAAAGRRDEEAARAADDGHIFFDDDDDDYEEEEEERKEVEKQRLASSNAVKAAGGAGVGQQQPVPPPPLAAAATSRLQTAHPVAPIQVYPTPGAGNSSAATASRAFQHNSYPHQAPPQPPQMVQFPPIAVPYPAAHPYPAGAGGVVPHPGDHNHQFHPHGGLPSPGAVANLNSRRYTNRISLCLFLFHLLVATAAVCFFSYKAVQGVLGDIGATTKRKERRALSFWLPPIEGSSVLAIILGYTWQRALRAWPDVMVTFILWFTFLSTMSAGVLLLCFSMPHTEALGVVGILFSIGTGLYACWVTRRRAFTAKIISRSLAPVPRFRDLNHPTHLMLGAGFLWISLWCFAVIGALNFYYPPVTILAMVLSLMWTAEVIRNVANLTVSRAVALYYLRGMQSNVQFCFQRAVGRNLGSACLGSLFVPAIEACRIVARGLNLLEGEDEFLFSCAHCCLRVMEAVFRYGNSWAFVHIAAYGRGFVQASQSTWDLFRRHQMEELVDSDITSSICFLTGVSSGSLCVIFAASWTFSSHKSYTATVSLLAFFVGYLMTRIGMALLQACVGCYYVCYAENPNPRVFDNTIPDRIAAMCRERGDGAACPTPRFPGHSARRVNAATT